MSISRDKGLMFYGIQPLHSLKELQYILTHAYPSNLIVYYSSNVPPVCDIERKVGRQYLNELMWGTVGVIMTGKHRRTQENPRFSVSLSITNPTRTGLEPKTVLRKEEPKTYLLSYNTPLQFSYLRLLIQILCYYLHFLRHYSAVSATLIVNTFFPSC